MLVAQRVLGPILSKFPKSCKNSGSSGGLFWATLLGTAATWVEFKLTCERRWQTINADFMTISKILIGKGTLMFSYYFFNINVLANIW